MKITVVAVGKLKERFWADACAEYAPDHFRIVYLPPMDVLHEAMEDLAEFFETYRQR